MKDNIYTVWRAIWRIVVQDSFFTWKHNTIFFCWWYSACICKLLLCNLISKLLETFLAVCHFSYENVGLPNQISSEWGELLWWATPWAWNFFFFAFIFSVSWKYQFWACVNLSNSRSLKTTYSLTIRPLKLAVANALILKSNIIHNYSEDYQYTCFN